MAFNRDKYKKAATRLRTLEADEQEIQDLIGFESLTYSIEPGKNLFRTFPRHLDSKSFIYARVVHWIPRKKTKDGKEEWKNYPILDARKHGSQEKDMVDEYIKYVKKMAKNEVFSTQKSKEILDDLTDWQKGLQGKADWQVYVSKKTASGWGDARLLSINASVKLGINIANTPDDEDDKLATDKFTDIDGGRPFVVKYFPKEPDNKKKYITTIQDSPLPLTDAQLIAWEEKDSLEVLFGTNSFTKDDLQLQLDGLMQYDTEKQIGAFGDDDWLDIVDGIRDSWSEEKSTNNNQSEVTEVKKETESKVENVDPSEKKEIEPISGEEFMSLDRTGLRKLISKNNLGLKVYKKESDDDIRDKIIASFPTLISLEEGLEEELEEPLEEELVEETTSEEVVEEAVEEAVEEPTEESKPAIGKDQLSQMKERLRQKIAANKKS